MAKEIALLDSWLFDDSKLGLRTRFENVDAAGQTFGIKFEMSSAPDFTHQMSSEDLQEAFRSALLKNDANAGKIIEGLKIAMSGRSPEKAAQELSALRSIMITAFAAGAHHCPLSRGQRLALTSFIDSSVKEPVMALVRN